MAGVPVLLAVSGISLQVCIETGQQDNGNDHYTSTAAVRESNFLCHHIMKLPWAFTWLSDCSHIPLFPLLDGHLLAFHSHIFTSISGIACEQLYLSSPLYIHFEPIRETTGLLVRTQAVSLSLPWSCIVYIKVDRRAPDRNQQARQALAGSNWSSANYAFPRYLPCLFKQLSHNQSLQGELGMQSCA
jgi:hypothetical protein